MQKKLLTVAVASALAMPAVALAQVTLYGSIDGGVRLQNKVVTATGTDKLWTVQSEGKKSNRWGMKGSEDLGGGLMANFVMEGGFATDDGTLATSGSSFGLFGRNITVGLSSGGNSVDIGKTYTLNFRTQGIYDPVSHDYGPSAGGSGVQGATTAGTRTTNSITAGFRFGAGGIGLQFAPGEVAGNTSWGTLTAINGDMVFGPVTVGAAYSSREPVTGGSSTDTMNLGAAWKMGALTLRAGLGTQETQGASDISKLSAGLQYDISPKVETRVSYYDLKQETGGAEVGRHKIVILNLEYKMSKRTIAYVALDRKKVSGNQAPGTVGSIADGATGLGAGISHSF